MTATHRTFLTDGPTRIDMYKGGTTLVDGKVYGFCRTPTRKFMRDAGTGSEPATRTLVAQFKGSSYIAEREGEELNIYLVTAGGIASSTTGENPASTATGDRMTASKFQKLVEAARR